jgi:hypothetical protein
MVFAILLAIAALAAALALGIRVRRQGVALGAATDRIATLSEDLDTARNDRAQQVVRADAAEAARDEALIRCTVLEGEVRTTATKLDDALVAHERARALVDDLRAQILVSADAATLWALELARVDRRWHVSVAPGIDLTSPVMSHAEADLPRLALEIIAQALREETGTRFTVDWQVTADLSPATALLVVRLGDEMLAASAMRCEMVELRVTLEPAPDRAHAHAVHLGLTAYDNSDQPVTLPDLDLLSGINWVPEHSGIVRDGMNVRVPLAVSRGAEVAA